MDNSKGYSKRPMWQWVVLYLVIGGLIYLVVYYFYFARKSMPYGATYNPPTAIPTANQITVTASGFQPQNATVKAGDPVVWNNQSGGTVSVDSTPHPIHSDYPPLNLGNIAPGASVSLVFPTAGTYKYHNHLNPGQFGSITVQ